MAQKSRENLLVRWKTFDLNQEYRTVFDNGVACETSLIYVGTFSIVTEYKA
jgi:hypothetical protein